ncbi:hemolysin family protein [Sediminicoccus rosea]|jgi:putative hemolysin|uniref:Hemolysin family protein n=1 Tax=Sediminicoccus rosea TaxID=1225128 RepID=A0ABZ0PCR9_9PROT|nr:hemolysin family protein [Sediminicoccus rosea]WPB83321.1 hemolysin family protein [Sediminicoccus rosea]
MGVSLEIIFVLFLTLLNGVFAMSELAVVSSRKGRLLAMERQGSRGAAAAIALQEDPQRFLPTVQVGITLVGILAGVFGGAAIAGPFGDWLETWPFMVNLGHELAFFLVVMTITYLNLILGELVPKQLALRNPEQVASALALPLTALARFTAPFIWFLSRSSALILRIFGAYTPSDQSVTEEEVKAVVAEGVEAGALVHHERQMIERVLRLADRPVRALMTPRPEVAWLDRNAAPNEIATALKAEPLTRFVVADGRVDNVVGVVAAKDLLDQVLEGGPLDIAAALRQPIVMPDSLSALDALERLRTDSLGMALVLDEYGSFEGVVTASDLLEAIVGELGPAPASEKPSAVQRHDGSFLLDGMMALDELRDRLDAFELPPQSGAYHTVGGLMLALLQRIPREGDRIAHAGWRFEIVDMDGRRVDKVLAVREEAAPAIPAEG